MQKWLGSACVLLVLKLFDINDHNHEIHPKVYLIFSTSPLLILLAVTLVPVVWQVKDVSMNENYQIIVAKICWSAPLSRLLYRPNLQRQWKTHLLKSQEHTCYPCLSCHLWGGSSGLSPRGVKHNIKHKLIFSLRTWIYAASCFKFGTYFSWLNMLNTEKKIITFSIDFLLLTE